jgi:hypothetical protein
MYRLNVFISACFECLINLCYSIPFQSFHLSCPLSIILFIRNFISYSYHYTDRRPRYLSSICTIIHGHLCLLFSIDFYCFLLNPMLLYICNRKSNSIKERRVHMAKSKRKRKLRVCFIGLLLSPAWILGEAMKESRKGGKRR